MIVPASDVERDAAKSSVPEHSYDGDDPIHHPHHYARLDPEPLDVIEAWRLDHHSACALKYIARAGHKAGAEPVVDLRKAITYLERRVRMLEAEAKE